MSTNDKKILIQENEIIHKTYAINTKGNKTAGINITISDKRVYVTDTIGENESVSIVSLDTVDFVKLENTSVKRKVHFLVYFGIILIFGGAILSYVSSNGGKPNYALLCIGIIVGTIFVTIGACLSGSISLSQIIIGTNSIPIKIDCNYIDQKFVYSIQHEIFVAKEKYVNKN